MDISGYCFRHDDLNTSPRRVLVVDDNIDAGTMLAEVLEYMGYEVLYFNDPAAALSQIKSFRPHSCISDIGMPIIDGYQFAASVRLHLHLPHVQLIALSGYTSLEDRKDACAAGFDHFMAKPVAIDALIALIGSP